MTIGKLFNYKPMKSIADYLSSFNCATQAFAAKTAGSDPDLKNTGTAACVINGGFIGSLTASATIDLSSATVAEPLANGTALAGKVVADNGQFFLLATVEADGTPHIYWAHNSATAADDVAPTFLCPNYATDELTYGVLLYDNDGTAGAFTIGTTNIVANDDTYYQLIGPSLIPQDVTIDKN
jgi:hypothetical protein